MPEHAPFRPERHQETVSGEIRTESGAYVSSLSGGNSVVPLPNDVGRTMQQMLRIQDGIAARLHTDPQIRSLVSLLNCRKTAAIAAGTLSPREATRQNSIKLDSKNAIREALDDPFSSDADGILDMLRDAERLIRSGSTPALWTPQQERITSQLRDDVFPKIVHVFAPSEKADMQSLLMKIVTRSLEIDDLVDMGFIHSFIVIGRGADGTYHCFHKQGPSLYEKVEVTSLDDLFSHHFAGNMERHYLSLAGPLKP